MKITNKIIIGALVAVSFSASAFAQDLTKKDPMADTSYSIGYNMCSTISQDPNLKKDGISTQELVAGFTAGATNQPPRIGKADILKKLQDFSTKIQKAKSLAQVEKFVKNSAPFTKSPYFPVVNEKKENKVMLLEFFDYQCGYCKKAGPVLEKVIQANPDVEFMFVEYPIFSSRMQESGYAAQMGVAVFKIGGEKAYLHYHNALLELKGKLTNKIIENTAKDSGVDAQKAVELAKDDDVAKHIQDMLAHGSYKIGISGTPFIVITSVAQPTVDNTEIIGGFTSQENIQKAIDNVKAKVK